MAPNSPFYFNHVAKMLLFCAFLVQSSFVAAANVATPAETLVASAQKVSEGFIALSWKDLGEGSVTLQVAADSEFTRLTRSLQLAGQDQVHLSGFADGVYFARLLDNAGASLSNTVRFEVEHRSLRSASLLFSVGAALFGFLVVTLFRFTRSDS